MTFLGIWHFSFTVSNIEESVAFYKDLLEFQVIRRARNDSAYVRSLVGYPDAVLEIAQLASPGRRAELADHDLELVQYVTPAGRRSEAQIRNPGESHLAITVDDADAVYQRLLGAGVSFVSPPNEITTGANLGGKGCYFRGPDDIMHELVEPPWARHRDP